MFDFATSAVARGEIELHRRAGKPVPDDWGYDADGQPTTDAAAVLDGAMRTFGGHKGSALAAMVELLAGPLIGDLTSARIRSRADGGRGGSPIGGELILAIDPAGFLGDAVAEHLARAEAMFAAIEDAGRPPAVGSRATPRGRSARRTASSSRVRCTTTSWRSGRRSVRHGILLALLLALLAEPVAAAPAATSADARLAALYTAEYAWRQQQDAAERGRTRHAPARAPARCRPGGAGGEARTLDADCDGAARDRSRGAVAGGARELRRLQGADRCACSPNSASAITKSR